MSETVWIKHPETGHVSEVPKDALSIYRQSNWDVLSDNELAAIQKQQADDQARAEGRIHELAAKALGNEPVTAAPVEEGDKAPDPEQATKSTKKKENG